jgi:putative lipoic acid-binding regulatory protein
MDEPPRVEFPCEYPIKVMARAGPALRARLDGVMVRHAGLDALQQVSERPSAQAHYIGVTYVINALSAEHIAAIFNDLKDLPDVLLVI